jgi:nucleoside diphosphate kinase
MNSFFFLKPDGIRPEILAEVLDYLGTHEIEIDEFQELRLTESQISALYPKYSVPERPFTVFSLRKYLLNRPLLYGKVVGDHPDVIDDLLSVKRSIRRKWGNRIYRNVMHCPQDADESTVQLCALFRPPKIRSELAHGDNHSWNGIPIREIYRAVDHFWSDVDNLDFEITRSRNRKDSYASLRCRLSWDCTWEDIITALIAGSENEYQNSYQLLLDSLRVIYSPQGLELDPCRYAIKRIEEGLIGEDGWWIERSET